MLKCPYCGNIATGKRIVDCRNMTDGRVCRRNKCPSCGKRFNTIEVYVSDDQKPTLNMFRRNHATVLWHPEKVPAPMAFIKRR